MNIAIVTINQENAAIASWLAAQDFSGCTLAHWQIEPQPVVAEQVLDALVEQWQRTPADVVLFPPGTFGDELSTRLAWRLHGASICQVTSLDIPTVSVRKSHWGNALTATLQTEKRPLCLSLARQAGAAKNATLPSGMQQLNIVPGALPDWLVSTEDLKLSLIHISEPTRLGMISYAVFCLKKKKKSQRFPETSCPKIDVSMQQQGL